MGYATLTARCITTTFHCGWSQPVKFVKKDKRGVRCSVLEFPVQIGAKAALTVLRLGVGVWVWVWVWVWVGVGVGVGVGVWVWVRCASLHRTLARFPVGGQVGEV